MPYSGLSERTRALDYLQPRVPQLVIEAGIRGAVGGHVTECSKSGAFVNGIVRSEDGTVMTTHLELISPRELKPFCACLEADGRNNEWCEHTVAVLLRACDLGFFSHNGGFDANQLDLRRHSSGPADIALVIRELRQTQSPSLGETQPGAVETVVLLDFRDDRLGVQVMFDGTPQAPALFGDSGKHSSRTLDNLLLDLLDQEGAWDEESQRWYVNSSKGVSLVLGLMAEFPQVVSAEDLRPVHIGAEVLDAVLTIEWLQSGAELNMYWLMPDGVRRPKERELLGNGPFWAPVDSSIYRVSTNAARIGAIFPSGSNMTVLGSQVGPLLEALQAEGVDSRFLEVQHPELQPLGVVKAPLPVLELQRRDTSYEHFTSGRRVDLEATLEFEYPAPPARQRVVHLPDRQKERECHDYLLSLGFEYREERKRYSLQEDVALDMLSGQMPSFPEDWRIVGLEQIRKGIKLADLHLAVSLNPLREENEEGEKPRGKAKQTRRPIDWFDCQIALILNNATVPLSTLFKNALADNARWLRLENGAYARIPGGSLAQLKTNLGMLDPNFRLSNTIKARVTTAQAVGISRSMGSQFEITADRSLRNILRKLEEFEGIERIKVGKSFHGKLRPYQGEGLSWLYFLHQFEFGGILADEMGLGKTVQALALLQYLRDHELKKRPRSKPSLVVAPTSVITNWWYEAKRFTPKLKVLLLHGPQRREAFSKLDEYDIVITSYALLRLDRSELERHGFYYIILDEAQLIKNYQAATTLAAKSLRAERRLALTGTPTENRPMELWSIIDFLMPGYLGSYEFFRNQIEKPILEGGPGVQVAKALRLRTRPFIMRRTKQEVERDLPPKIESVLHVEMAESQRQLYSQVLHEVRPRVMEAVRQKGISGASISILAALLRLRQVCNHPNSIDALKEVPGFESGKFNLLKDLLEEALENGRKVLLFGQFKEMLAIIRRHLEQTKVKYLYLDGATRNRQEIIDRFNEDEKVRLFLISLKAGGLGLNLTAADMVIIYDPWWNPAVESQAVDRAHRIGQRKTVYVYRIVTENSVEQKIMSLKKRKSEIVDALINENGLSTISLSKGDLESLFSETVPA